MQTMIEEKEEFKAINKKINDLNNKVTALQDIILTMHNDFKIFFEANLRTKSIPQLDQETNKCYKGFLADIPSDCKFRTQCSLIIENEVFKVLRIYELTGPSESLKYLEGTIIKLKKLIKKSNCRNENCINNAFKIFTILTELISEPHEKHLNANFIEDISPNANFFNDELDEAISELLAPLSNNLRIKILKELSKGSKSFTQLEQEIKIQGGHLQHHLKYLIKANYVEKKGDYHLTTSGLIILKYLNNLSKIIYNQKYE